MKDKFEKLLRQAIKEKDYFKAAIMIKQLEQLGFIVVLEMKGKD